MENKRLVLSLAVGFSVAVVTTLSGQRHLAAQTNSLGGTVRATDGNGLGGVTVIVMGTNINDKTRADDGVYVLQVPSGDTELLLLFQKTNYYSQHRTVENDRSQNKGPIVKLIAIGRTKHLDPDAMKDIVRRTEHLFDLGSKWNSKRMLRAAEENVEALDRELPKDDPKLKPLLKSVEFLRNKFSR